MIPDNITEEHIIKAIQEIEKNGIRKGRQSSTYDLVYEGKNYPPKLVISIANRYANGTELDGTDFDGGKGTPAFKLLEREGFTIEQKVNFTWVTTHRQIVDYLVDKEDSQEELIGLLKSVGIDTFNDKTIRGGEHDTELEEIDPFTFFCYIYKHGARNRLKYLQEIAKTLEITIPSDEKGIPSAQAQKVWLFPYKYERTNNEIPRLWQFFRKELSEDLSDDDFEDALKIRSVGKTKLTEALFYIKPEKYLPINGPTKPYIEEVLSITPSFDTYSEYVELLEEIRGKTDLPFYELSYEAWLWNKKRPKLNYWVFQGNPKAFDFKTGLRQEILSDWTVTAHKGKINVGDKVILWITGNKAGCYALAEITKKPREVGSLPDDHLWKVEDSNTIKAGIKITHNLIDSPILKASIDSIEELKDLKVGHQGTNFSATEEQFQVILKMTRSIHTRKFWLYAPGENASKWDEFYEKGIMGLGWDEIGDLNELGDKDSIVKTIQTTYNTESKSYNSALANLDFRDTISVGDIIIPKKGRKDYLGYGVVTSGYYYDSSRDSYQKCRKVNWVKKGVWKEDSPTIAIKTLTDITKYPGYVDRLIELIGIEQESKKSNISDMHFSLNTIFYGPPGTGKTYNTVVRAAEIIENRKINSYDEALDIFKANLHDRIEFITFHQNYSYEDFIQGLRPDTEDESEQLRFKKSDGIFKKIADRALKNLKESEKAPEEVSQTQAFLDALEQLKDKILDSDEPIKINDTTYFSAVEDDAFRYTGDNWTLNNKGFSGFRMKYSDLVRFFEEDVKERKEIKNLENISGLAKQHASYFIKAYNVVKSLMTQTPQATQRVLKKNYVIVIDEINRANISRVFGELITLIEPDKRFGGSIPMETKLPSGDLFAVPSNLYIIGTMNTADKSIALLDIALRRRFEFESMYPNYRIEGVHDVEILKKINEEIKKTKGHDFQIGHAYFMGKNEGLVGRMNKKVIPLLLEYYMNDEKEVKSILQSAGLIIEEHSWPIRITGKA